MTRHDHGHLDMSRSSCLALCRYCQWRDLTSRPSRHTARHRLDQHLLTVHAVDVGHRRRTRAKP